MNQSLLTAINPCLHDWAQTAQQEIEQRKKMESREEKETSSSSTPSKAAAQKVSHMLERFYSDSCVEFCAAFNKLN